MEIQRRTSDAAIKALAVFTLLGSASLVRAECLSPVPDGFPQVDLPFQTQLPAAASERVSAARVALGKRLFHDRRLSVNQSTSCATCHDPARAFTDQQPTAIGALGERLPFNAPTLHNAALKFSFNWQPDGPTQLATQHGMVLSSTDPVEMGFSESLLEPHNADPELLALLANAEVAPAGSFNQTAVQKLLAAFVASLRCATAFDRFLFEGDTNALTEQQRRGLALFTSAPMNCHSCHQGPLLGGGLRTPATAFPAHITARKRAGNTTRLAVPALRRVGQTAPYFFDGSVTTLSEVLDQYAEGRFHDLPGFPMSNLQRQALIAFLRVL